MALRGQGSLQALLGRSQRSGAKRSAPGGGGGGGGTAGGASAGKSSGSTAAASGLPPAAAAATHRQGGITDFFAPRQKKRAKQSPDADGDDSAGAAASSVQPTTAPGSSGAAGTPAGGQCSLVTPTAAEQTLLPCSPSPLRGVDRCSSPASAPRRQSSWALEARIVGRRHTSGAARGQHLTPASHLALRREPHNRADANAIQVVLLPAAPRSSEQAGTEGTGLASSSSGGGSGDGGGGNSSGGDNTAAGLGSSGDAGPPIQAAAGVDRGTAGLPVGHLPAVVARHIAPLLDAGRVAVDGVALVPGTADLVCITLSLQPQPSPAATPQGRQRHGSAEGGASQGREGRPSPGGGCGRSSSGGSRAWAADVAAAIEGAVEAGSEPAGGTGRVLVGALGAMMARVRECDAHLLDSTEWAALDALAALPLPPAALCLRLLLRHRPWHPVASLGFDEVPDAPEAAAALVAADLARREDCVRRGADLAALLEALPADTLRAALLQLLPVKHPAALGAASSGKPALVAAAQAAAPPARVVAAVRGLTGPLIQPSPALHRAFARLQRVYFLEEGRDASAFVAAERGGVRWPRYPLSRGVVSAWPSRAALLEYEQALHHAAALEDALADEDTKRTWRCLEPALSALRSGAHKRITWDSAHGPLPNTPLEPTAEQQQQQAAVEEAAAGEQQQQQEEEEEEEEWQQNGIGQQQQQQQQQDQSSPEGEAGGDPAWWQEQQEQEGAWQQEDQELVSQGTGGGSRDWLRGASEQQQRDGGSTEWGEEEESEEEQQSQQRREEEEEQAGPSGDPLPPPSSSNGTLAAAQPALPPADATPADALAAPATLPAPAPRPLFFARLTAGWVYASMGTVAASLLERERRYPEAVDLLQLLLGGNACPARRGAWWLRLSINLEHLKQVDAALEMAEAALADRCVRHGDRLALQRRVLRLGKPPRRWKRPAWAAAVAAEPRERRIVGRPLAGSVGSRNRYYGYEDCGQVCVEDLALQHYAQEAEGAWRGIHTEGGVWATLFGLLLWDEIFSDVPGVFRSPFQSGPLDMRTDAFFPARAAAIEARLQEVALGGAGRLIEATWAAHCGEISRGISWQRFPLQQLLEIAECVGGVGLSVVLRLMAEDPEGSSGGLPDLLLWRLEPHKEARLVEVKGPTDRLSEQQRAWIAAMLAAGMDLEVCKVAEPS